MKIKQTTFEYIALPRRATATFSEETATLSEVAGVVILEMWGGENTYTFQTIGMQSGHHDVSFVCAIVDSPIEQTRIQNVQNTVTEVLNEVFYDQSQGTFMNTTAKLGWGLFIFNEVMDIALTTEFNTRSGLIAIQATDLSNLDLPAGEAFYANAAGDRALAACLVRDPQRRTFEHEIGHALFLNHTYHTQEPSDPNRYHQRTDPSAGSCIMHVTPTDGCDDNCIFCGFCQVRLWGWSVLTVDPATGNTAPPRTIYYHEDYNRDPGAPGAPLADPRNGGNHRADLV